MKDIICFVMIVMVFFVEAQVLDKIATLEEYDALPHDQQIKAYNHLPKDVRSKVVAREQAEMAKSRKEAEEERKKRSKIASEGWVPMVMEALLFEQDMSESLIKAEHPDPTDPQRAERLKKVKEHNDSEMKILGLTEHAPKVEVWNKHKARFEELQKQYPLEKPSLEALAAIEKEVKSLLSDVEKIPKIK